MPPRLSLRPRQVLEEDRLGKRIGHVQFGLMGNEEIERLAEYEVVSDRGYEQPGRRVTVRVLGLGRQYLCPRRAPV